jgi:hypothetical protein
MSTETLRRLARELLKYGEQMYLERCAAIAVLEALNIPERQMLFAKSVGFFESRVHEQFQPLRDLLDAVIGGSQTQDATEKLLRELPKGRLN